jgi:hypothetical protein
MRNRILYFLWLKFILHYLWDDIIVNLIYHCVKYTNRDILKYQMIQRREDLILYFYGLV